MKRKLIIVVNIFLVIIFLLMSFQSVVKAQVVTTDGPCKLNFVINEIKNNDLRNSIINYQKKSASQFLSLGGLNSILDMIIFFLIRLVIWWIDIHS